ncbi:MAG: PhoPQ-activated protein PqaA family protein [Bryobacteraceae bacterium]
MDWLGTKQMKNLMKIEEPFQYRDRLTMPKYMVNSAGDQFFIPDSSQFYFDKLKGERYLRYIPNTDHSLRNSDAPLGLPSPGCSRLVLVESARPGVFVLTAYINRNPR